MIFHEEDYNRANIILFIDNQCGLQALLNYIFIYTFNWLGTTLYFIINNISEIKTIDQCRQEKDICICWPLFSLLFRLINLDDKSLVGILLTKTFIIDNRLLILYEQFNHILQMYLTLKLRLLGTDETISEDLCRILLHTFTADCFPLKNIELHKSRYVMKINLLDYFYSIFFEKNPSCRFEHRLNTLTKFILKILTSV
ncbi:unnamed protein product [Adineta steineri]|uniref:Uncharacterized protein n=1 Tax=Adineta steineri TaxID=433720 RepID=A0A813UAI3_9BILA|nr:unnamed protein product [Adineta steineri]CAF0868114.1 unnamed protein product [Adineta steineri]CAF3823139.1 unnamed protein product [Adineta steineri]CAF4081804.1 unnamed protein product [Adineta steineri]